MGNVDYTKNPLVKKFIEVETNENKVKNIFLYAGGGYGKTTAMCCLFKYLLDKASNGEKIVPIYIDVKKLNFNEINPIISYIHSEYSGSDTKESDVKNLFSDQSPEFSKQYTYYILIDGLNETNDVNKGNLIDIISRMAEISNVRFVVSSRIKETFDKAPFCIFEMQKLNEEQIKDYLDKNFGEKYNEQTEVKRINKSRIEILQIPMFMKTFSKSYDKSSPYPDIYDEKTVRKADILDSYVQKIRLNLKERTNSYDNNILEFVINFYLPALAFQMAEENVLNIDSEIVDKKLCLDYFLSFFKGTKKEQIKSLVNDKKFMPISISSKNFALINDNDGNYSFVHQIWRDFFAAKHIINCMNAEKLDELEISVDENIRQFVGELVREYVVKYKYSKKPAYKSILDNLDTRKSECDFEKKDNAKKPYSPIEDFLQKHNMNSAKPISAIVTKNLIEIMKTCRNNNLANSNFRNLNLKKVNFKNTNFSNCDFRESEIYVGSLYQELLPERTIGQAVSKSGRYVALANETDINIIEVASKNIVISIYESFQYPLNNICKVEFILDNYLLVCYEKSASLYYINDEDIDMIYIVHVFDYYFEDNNLKYVSDLYLFPEKPDDDSEMYSLLYLNDSYDNSSINYNEIKYSFEESKLLVQKNTKYFEYIIKNFISTLEDNKQAIFIDCLNIIHNYAEEKKTCSLNSIFELLNEEQQSVYKKYIKCLENHIKEILDTKINYNKVFGSSIFMDNAFFWGASNNCNNFDACHCWVDESEEGIVTFWIAFLCDGNLYIIYHYFGLEKKCIIIDKTDFTKKICDESDNLKLKRIINYKDKCFLGIDNFLGIKDVDVDMTIEKIPFNGNSLVTDKTVLKSHIPYELWCSKNDNIISFRGFGISTPVIDNQMYVNTKVDIQYYDIDSGKFIDKSSQDLKKYYQIECNQSISNIPSGNYYFIRQDGGNVCIYYYDKDKGVRNFICNIKSQNDFFKLNNAIFDEKLYHQLTDLKRKELIKNGVKFEFELSANKESE